MLEIMNMSKTFYPGTINEKTVFTNFSLEVKNDDFITIIGSNGAGKSTLLNIISGNIKQDEGEIILDKKEISKLPEYKRARKISRVYQNPVLGTSPSMTILENLSMVLNKNKNYGLTFGVSAKNIAFFKETLAKLDLGLENQLNSKVGLLSGGQRQALSLLMATIVKPDLLLLDEHTAALDPNTSKKILELTESLIRVEKIPTLMVTHNMSDAIKYGNRLIMMDSGKVVLDINGSMKLNLTTEKLFELFKNIKSDHVLSDRLILS